MARSPSCRTGLRRERDRRSPAADQRAGGGELGGGGRVERCDDSRRVDRDGRGQHGRERGGRAADDRWRAARAARVRGRRMVRPSIASDGSDYLVVWQSAPNTISGARFRPGTGPLDGSSGFVIAQAAGRRSASRARRVRRRQLPRRVDRDPRRGRHDRQPRTCARSRSRDIGRRGTPQTLRGRGREHGLPTGHRDRVVGRDVRDPIWVRGRCRLPGGIPGLRAEGGGVPALRDFTRGRERRGPRGRADRPARPRRLRFPPTRTGASGRRRLLEAGKRAAASGLARPRCARPVGRTRREQMAKSVRSRWCAAHARPLPCTKGVEDLALLFLRDADPVSMTGNCSVRGWRRRRRSRGTDGSRSRPAGCTGSRCRRG